MRPKLQYKEKSSPTRPLTQANNFAVNTPSSTTKVAFKQQQGACVTYVG